MGIHDGAPYLVSELLEGQPLRDELESAAKWSSTGSEPASITALSQGAPTVPPGRAGEAPNSAGGATPGPTVGRFPIRKAVDYAVQIAEGLAAAHGRGVVHRDLKPENLFVTQTGRLKILDFGLAKLTQTPPGRPGSDSGGGGDAEPTGMDPQASTVVSWRVESTEPGRVMGTPSYMAPEQVRGETADHRADIFAFGCILYEMLTGIRAFRRNTSAESMAAVLNEEPPDLGELSLPVPPGLGRVVRRCLEKQPENRFQSAKDLAFALEQMAGAAPSTAQAPAVLPGTAVRRSV